MSENAKNPNNDIWKAHAENNKRNPKHFASKLKKRTKHLYNNKT